MKRIVSWLLILSVIVTGCAGNTSTTDTATTTNQAETNTTELSAADSITSGSESPEVPEFTDLGDPDLLRYLEDRVYADIVPMLPEDMFVENVSAVYISKEYIEELGYNSQVNVFYGYTLEELDQQFQGTKYIFTLGEDGSTVVQEFVEYEDIYAKVLKNVLIGSGVILFCVTVSAISGGLGAPAVSMIFAASAKTGTVMAFSSGSFAAITAGTVELIQTGDMEKALQAAAESGSEAFKWGAFAGSIGGGAGEALALHGATANGLTMNQVATIQKESKYPLDVIKGFKNMEQYQICKDAGLTADMINGKAALVRNIDLGFVDDLGRTNLERMQQGLAALDPTGTPYELHHIGQQMDSTLAILTKAEHMQGGNNAIWHEFGIESQIDRGVFATQKRDFWQTIAKALGG